MKKTLCMVALAAISFSSVMAATPSMTMSKDTAKTKVKHKETKTKVKKKKSAPKDSTKM